MINNFTLRFSPHLEDMVSTRSNTNINQTTMNDGVPSEGGTMVEGDTPSVDLSKLSSEHKELFYSITSYFDKLVAKKNILSS